MLQLYCREFWGCKRIVSFLCWVTLGKWGAPNLIMSLSHSFFKWSCLNSKWQCPRFTNNKTSKNDGHGSVVTSVNMPSNDERIRFSESKLRYVVLFWALQISHMIETVEIRLGHFQPFSSRESHKLSFQVSDLKLRPTKLLRGYIKDQPSP